MSYRVGSGHDTHRLAEGRPLILGGVRIDHPKGLVGHSDADAVLHAVTDALLGAAGLGDIGDLYPDTDPQWKDADSRLFLTEALARLTRLGWRPVNLDVTVFAQEPKLGPVKAAIRASLAALLGLPADAVNVKAKTGERVGHIGRGEALGCHAVVLIERQRAVNLAAVVAEILRGYALPVRGFHGVVHWARVLENGLRLAETTGANVEIVRLFAVFHDSRRENDGTDPGHGGRGADLAAELRGTLFDLPDADFELLYRACERHTEGRDDPDATVRTCWDADRLDLGRVGIVPAAKYLCTPAARNVCTLNWAHGRAVRGDEPAFVTAEWQIPPRAW